MAPGQLPRWTCGEAAQRPGTCSPWPLAVQRLQRDPQGQGGEGLCEHGRFVGRASTSASGTSPRLSAGKSAHLTAKQLRGPFNGLTMVS